MVDTSALKQNNNPAEAVPKSSRGWKWKTLLRRIWKDKSQYEGQGIGTTVVIPSDLEYSIRFYSFLSEHLLVKQLKKQLNTLAGQP